MPWLHPPALQACQVLPVKQQSYKLFSIDLHPSGNDKLRKTKNTFDKIKSFLKLSTFFVKVPMSFSIRYKEHLYY